MPPLPSFGQAAPARKAAPRPLHAGEAAVRRRDPGTGAGRELTGRLLLRRHHHGHVHRLDAAAARDAADRRRLAGVAAGAEADVALVRAAAVGRVEADPAEALDMDLGPGVRRLADLVAVAGQEVAGDVARRQPGGMGERDQRVRLVLADALADAPAPRRRWCRRRWRRGRSRSRRTPPPTAGARARARRRRRAVEGGVLQLDQRPVRLGGARSPADRPAARSPRGGRAAPRRCRWSRRVPSTSDGDPLDRPLHGHRGDLVPRAVGEARRRSSRPRRRPTRRAPSGRRGSTGVSRWLWVTKRIGTSKW